MAEAFNRVAELYVGTFQDGNSTSKGYQIDGLDFDFDVKRSSAFYRDSASFTIYNFNDETAQQIMDGGCSVIFRAGYKNQQVGNIFIGQIARAWPEFMPDGTRTMNVVCNAQRGAQYPLTRTYISLSFPVGSSLYSIIKNIADFVGVPLSGASGLKSVTLSKDDGPYVDTGSVRDVVCNFVRRKLRALGWFVILSNNEMICIDKTDKTTLETVYLNFKSGLLSAKPLRDDSFQSSEEAFNENRAYYLGETGEKKKTTKAIPKSGKASVSFESILNPALSVGLPIYIDARRNSSDHLSVLGKFWIKELEFKGSNYGNEFSASGKAEERA